MNKVIIIIIIIIINYLMLPTQGQKLLRDKFVG